MVRICLFSFLLLSSVAFAQKTPQEYEKAFPADFHEAMAFMKEHKTLFVQELGKEAGDVRLLASIAFPEMLYEYTSASANNGSGFEGLGDNNLFWNITTGIILLLSRFLPIIAPIAIAGHLAQKKYIPESAGTLQTDNATFGTMVFVVIFIIAALSFFPALALGPFAEYFSTI